MQFPVDSGLEKTMESGRSILIYNHILSILHAHITPQVHLLSSSTSPTPSFPPHTNTQAPAIMSEAADMGRFFVGIDFGAT
jgi:hypothetical protein